MVTIGLGEKLEKLESFIKAGDYEKAQAMFPEVISDAKTIEGDRNFLYARNICSRNPRSVCPKLGKRGNLEDSLFARNQILQRETEELRIELFRTKMNLLLQTRPNYREVPFGYCDRKGQILYTPAVADIFGVTEDRVTDFSHLKAIYESVRKGVRLKDFELKPGVFIYTYPLSYCQLPVGVAFVLNNPGTKLDNGKLYRFVREVLQEVRMISNDYKLLKKRLETPNQ